jgi:pre-mRNA-splicing factor ATP-dependent RNA helicase DHX15/PRP43
LKGGPLKEPLYGFTARKVTGPQVLKAMVCLYFLVQTWFQVRAEGLVQKDGDVNPFTKEPHSAQYKKILESRKKLPVFNQMDEFMEVVSLWVS